MTIKLIFEEHPEPAFDCMCCGTCFPDHWTISISKEGYSETLLWEYNHDGHPGGFQTGGCIVTYMKNALLAMETSSGFEGDYARNSIQECFDQVMPFAGTLFTQWSKVKAYALALEDDGCDIIVEAK